MYEWVWIDYKCDGYDEVETMGFGTNHIITFERDQLINDTYSEITGYEVGDRE